MNVGVNQMMGVINSPLNVNVSSQKKNLTQNNAKQTRNGVPTAK
jgi:hypothetical protein